MTRTIDPPQTGPALGRRAFCALSLRIGATAAVALLVPRRVAAKSGALDPSAATAAAESPLIYVSPLARDGSESTCHGEVWFVVDGSDLLVVTSPDRWRARAISKGLDRARIWIGDYGVWTSAGGSFKEAPTIVARATIVADTGAHARALEAFGAKYSDEWSKWGPRFESGLASGERVLIRYTPV